MRGLVFGTLLLRTHRQRLAVRQLGAEPESGRGQREGQRNSYGPRAEQLEARGHAIALPELRHASCGDRSHVLCQFLRDVV